MKAKEKFIQHDSNNDGLDRRGFVYLRTLNEQRQPELYVAGSKEPAVGHLSAGTNFLTASHTSECASDLFATVNFTTPVRGKCGR